MRSPIERKRIADAVIDADRREADEPPDLAVLPSDQPTVAPAGTALYGAVVSVSTTTVTLDPCDFAGDDNGDANVVCRTIRIGGASDLAYCVPRLAATDKPIPYMFDDEGEAICLVTFVNVRAGATEKSVRWDSTDKRMKFVAL